MTVSTPKPLVKTYAPTSGQFGALPNPSKTNGLKKQIKDILDEASNANVGSETNEAPVESVSQPKAADGYLKEFDEFLENHGNFMGGIGSNMIFKLQSFFKSSIERARREGGVEAIEMVVDEEMIDQWQRNVYLKMWREKSEF